MTPRVVLVGEVVVDVTLGTATADTKLRFGGVFHAARALWAAGVAYDLAYFAPAYLTKEIDGMAANLGGGRVVKIGDITGAPNVMLIAEATEAGSQGYEHLMWEHLRFSFSAQSLLSLFDSPCETLILAGNFDLSSLLGALSTLKSPVHVDMGNGPAKIDALKSLGRLPETLFLSTSAAIFPELAPALPKSVQDLVGVVASEIVLKENRGGVRHFSIGEPVKSVGSQRRDIVHSVGVGDAFDAIFVAFAKEEGVEGALSYAAWIAAEYAATTFPDDLKRAVEQVLRISAAEIAELPSVILPWEARPSRPIYIAAPDFDYVNTSAIDALEAALKYHNFRPRRPVKENGQAKVDMTPNDKRVLYGMDIQLLAQCGVVVGVNIYDDPGTLIELGMAVERGIPTFVYDPSGRAQNVMLVCAPDLVSSSLDKIVTATFDAVAKMVDRQ
jgi:nucleoside 2-deoxyribosyltransferase